MHYVTTNPKAKRTNLEERLLVVAQELARKNHHLGMIESYLGNVLEEWKSTRDKYRNTRTTIHHNDERVWVENALGERIFTVS